MTTPHERAYAGVPRGAPRVRVDARPRRAARRGSSRASTGRARLPRLHRQRPLRRVAGEAPRRACCSGGPRQPALRRTRPRAASTRARRECRRACSTSSARAADEYAVVFTANASHALKLVGESYPFEPGDRFLLTFDNHNSVNGIREFDRARGAETDLRADGPARPARGRGGACAGT